MAAKTRKPSGEARLRAEIRELEGALAITNEECERTQDELRQLRDLLRIRDEQRANDARQLRQLAPATTSRRVVRTLVYEGDPTWVASTLAASLREGGTRLADKATITVTTTEDTTTFFTQGRSGILEAYQNQTADEARG